MSSGATGQTAASSWLCRTCGKTIATAFCPQCGERPVQPNDLTLRGLGQKVFNAVTSVDGRLLRSLWCLLRRPGVLTVAYVNGPRKPYVTPLQLFLFANVVFFAVQSLSATNIFGATLASHLHDQDWSGLAQTMVARRLADTHSSFESFAPVFDQAVALNAKSLIIIMAVPFAFLLPLVFFSVRRPFVAHVAFSLHLYAFLLLLFSLSLLVAIVDVLVGGAGLRSARVDNALSAFNFVACAVYLYVAVGMAYEPRNPMRAIKALLLAGSVGAFVLGYRFLLFVITLYGA